MCPDSLRVFLSFMSCQEREGQTHLLHEEFCILPDASRWKIRCHITNTFSLLCLQKCNCMSECAEETGHWVTGALTL